MRPWDRFRRPPQAERQAEMRERRAEEPGEALHFRTRLTRRSPFWSDPRDEPKSYPGSTWPALAEELRRWGPPQPPEIEMWCGEGRNKSRHTA